MIAPRAATLAIVCAACLALAPAAPKLTLPQPWQLTVGVPPPTDFVTLVEWVLPNGQPGAPPSALQYVSEKKKPLDEGGVGGYVADAVAGLNATHSVSAVKYEKIDTCVREAWIVSFQVTVNASPRAFEEVYLAVGSSLYEAEYNRPAGQAVDPAAHAALLGYCTTVKRGA